MEDESAVLIVGAGPTGLTLACDLLGRGIAATVVDKAAGPATTSRALGLQPRGREILARLGALGDLPERAVHAVATNIRLRSRLLTKFVVRSARDPDALGPLLISQAEIEAQLRLRLAELGGAVRWDHQVVAITQKTDGVETRVRTPDGERSLHAGWLVGCDGAHSAVRELIGVAFEGRPFAETLVLADVELAEPAGADSEGSFWLDEDGVIGTVPLPGGKWRIFAELPSDDPLAALGSDADTASTAPPPVSEAVLDRVGLLLRKRVGFAAPRIICGSWTSVFRFHRRIASAYRRGRVFIAGDAAHIHSALGGQGMNTGLGDVFNLGWKLTSVIRGQAEDRLLDTYEAERRPVAAAVVRKTTRDWNIMIGRTWFDRMFRDHVLLPLLRKPSMQQRWLESGSQLRISYRGGPLARMTVSERWSSMRGHAPLAGDRAPNAVCRLGPSGAATTLGALIGANWALLLFGGAAADRAACVAAAERRLAGLHVVRVHGDDDDPYRNGVELMVEDPNNELAEAYRPDPRGAAILLRPDGYIAWRTSPMSPEGLVAWCADNGIHRAGRGDVGSLQTRTIVNPTATAT